MVATYRESRKDFNVSSEDQPSPKTRRKKPNWPNLLMRMQWATKTTTDLHLNGVESSILKHVCFVDGIGQGCFEDQRTMVKETGWSHATISRALASLTEKGLLESKRRMGRATKYLLLGIVTMPSEPISERDDLISERDDLISERDDLISERDDGYLGERYTVISERDDGYLGERYTVISERDDPHLGERQQNPVRNQEELTSNLLSELSESGELKNISGTGGQADQWKPPELAPKLFSNPMAFSKFVGAFQSGGLTRDWAHELKEHGGGVTLQEIWGFEEWFADTHRITNADEYEKLIAENIRRLKEEHHGPALVEEVAA